MPFIKSRQSSLYIDWLVETYNRKTVILVLVINRAYEKIQLKRSKGERQVMPGRHKHIHTNKQPSYLLRVSLECRRYPEQTEENHAHMGRMHNPERKHCSALEWFVEKSNFLISDTCWMFLKCSISWTLCDTQSTLIEVFFGACVETTLTNLSSCSSALLMHG